MTTHVSLESQESISPYVGEMFWSIKDRMAIEWDVEKERRLPHRDHIEMAGRKVAAIIDYEVDANRMLSVGRTVIYPQLQVYLDTDSPSWGGYRAYLKNEYKDDALPGLLVNDLHYKLGPLQRARIDGTLSFLHEATSGIQVKRSFLPAMNDRLLAEVWTVSNLSGEAKTLELLPARSERIEKGEKGFFRLQTRSVGLDSKKTLRPGEELSFAVFFETLAEGESPASLSVSEVVAQREAFLSEIRGKLALKTPDPVIDTLFYFSKIRAAESIFDSKLGVVHSPGGGNYYVGVWANDQAEYSGPFFPYLGYELGNEAALNAYLIFLDNMPEGDEKIFSSFEMEGELTCCSKDRGDAAMLAIGASQFALARGDAEIAKKFWPLIDWGLEYSRRHMSDEGLLQTDSDEMEGRIATGDANLAASSLYYGALREAAKLAAALQLGEERVADYESRADALEKAIESHFGAKIAGLDTYRYFAGHEGLRHWISLPLVMGLRSRAEDTLTALFDIMWTTNGVRVEWSPNEPDRELFWDRGTLYALRGAFIAGSTDLALDRWLVYSATRLLGFHVPYAIEAWPENNMRHLSAESALYARIATEGLLGMKPDGFASFVVTPRLPEDWREEGYELSRISIQGRTTDIEVRSRRSGLLFIRVVADGRTVVEKEIAQGESVRVEF
ncbi:hypothetical protein [Pelagicoccus sp. SDUM812002]|uniref:hypothetical protein n=1 Tax=Pelagicoccus sp. SDUM812002 TaxID=3041266 RepID=UPI00280C8814|nr:hypothetical protein [Pelagicoccus sp. SDUM812002]MDQ8188045.1 hypothetical protein [Pelagicoccus sp. SDUM812002]